MLKLASGCTQENTRLTSEGRWYESDKIRFRQGTPETIGGWERVSPETFVGVCRSLFSWTTLTSITYTGVGTNLKFYVHRDGYYYDITPIRASSTINADPFATTDASATVVVTDTAHGAGVGDFVTFSGATDVGGLTLNGEYQVSFVVDADTYRFVASAAATSTATGGGAAVTAAYQLNTGPESALPSYGWGSGYWSYSTWGNATQATGTEIRVWSQANYGEDLIFGPRYGGIYYWDSSVGTGTRAVNVTSMGGASDVPVVQQILMVSDSSRFVLAFGCNAIGSSTLDPMLIRWSDQEDVTNWTPAITNQAGSYRLSIGSEIYSAIQMRQEILVWTNAALYSLQYLGAPLVWGATLLDSNISCPRPNGTVIASGIAYWMGADKFYKYDGRVQTLRCDLRAYVFGDINKEQNYQFFATTNEAFNEVWWFYCSAASTTVDKYVVYNYLEDIWYYGTMARTAWLDSSVSPYPIAATYSHNLVLHEYGTDDNETGTPAALNAFITSSQFDIQDGHNFSFIWRILPDLTFRGSSETGATPNVTMTLLPLQNSGSGYTVPPSVGGSNDAVVSRIGTYTVDQFTGQINTRIRARQMSLKISSNTIGTKWQLGSPRLDIRPDGRKT